MNTTEQFIMYIKSRTMLRRNNLLLFCALSSGRYEITENLMIKGIYTDEIRKELLLLILSEKKDFLEFKIKLDLEKKLQDKFIKKNRKEKVKKI